MSSNLVKRTLPGKPIGAEKCVFVATQPKVDGPFDPAIFRRVRTCRGIPANRVADRHDYAPIRIVGCETLEAGDVHHQTWQERDPGT